MANFLQNPGPARNWNRISFEWAQHQAEHSSMGPVLSPALYPFNIRPLMLSCAVALELFFCWGGGGHLQERRNPPTPKIQVSPRILATVF